MSIMWSHHVVNLDVAIREGDGIRRRGNRDHECIGGRDGGRNHEVERVNAEVGTL